MAPDDRPDMVLTSPYLRAQGTAQAVVEAGGLAPQSAAPVIDERLREREFGILDRLTRAGIRELYPEQAELRHAIGKFYHRPPGGESWCDVILRLRSALNTIGLHYADKRLLIVGHQVVVLCLRYLIENLTEPELMAIDAEGDVVNCGITEYRFDPRTAPNGGLRLVRYNLVAPLEEAGAPVTSAPDAPVAAR
jgi:broad specificity phosphatase PhoE